MSIILVTSWVSVYSIIPEKDLVLTKLIILTARKIESDIGKSSNSFAGIEKLNLKRYEIITANITIIISINNIKTLGKLLFIFDML